MTKEEMIKANKYMGLLAQMESVAPPADRSAISRIRAKFMEAVGPNSDDLDDKVYAEFKRALETNEREVFDAWVKAHPEIVEQHRYDSMKDIF